MSRYKTKITDYGYKEKISAYNHPIQYMDEAEKKKKTNFLKSQYRAGNMKICQIL